MQKEVKVIGIINNNSVTLVCKRTIQTERPPFVGEEGLVEIIKKKNALK
jgi:hypothetical protein